MGREVAATDVAVVATDVAAVSAELVAARKEKEAEVGDLEVAGREAVRTAVEGQAEEVAGRAVAGTPPSSARGD